MIFRPPPPVRIVQSGREKLWSYAPSRADDCPGYMWVYDRAHGRAEVRNWICGSVQHMFEPCAPKYVAEQIDNLNHMFHMPVWVDGEPERRQLIYFTTTIYDSRFLNRMNQRRHSDGGGYVVIRRGRGRVDGWPATLDIYADRPYSGTCFPAEADWISFSPEVAIQRVANHSLLLPGVFSAKGATPVTSSGIWEPSLKKRKRESEPDERFLTLGVARSKGTFKAAEKVMAAIVAVHLPKHSARQEDRTYDTIPATQLTWWVDTTWSVVGQLKAGRTVEEVIDWWLTANISET